MRRILLAASLLSLVVSLGCRHVSGTCDCYQSEPEVGAGSAQPYPVTGATVPGTAVPEKLSMPEKSRGK